MKIIIQIVKTKNEIHSVNDDDEVTTKMVRLAEKEKGWIKEIKNSRFWMMRKRIVEEEEKKWINLKTWPFLKRLLEWTKK